MNISMKLVYQYMAIFFNFLTTSNHLHALQVGNCDSNSRLVVDEDDNDKLRFERVNGYNERQGAAAEARRLTLHCGYVAVHCNCHTHVLFCCRQCHSRWNVSPVNNGKIQCVSPIVSYDTIQWVSCKQ